MDNSGFQTGVGGGILVSGFPRILSSQEPPSGITVDTPSTVVYPLFSLPALCNSKLLFFSMTPGKFWTSRVFSGLIYFYFPLWSLLA